MELNNIFAKYFIPSNDIVTENKNICANCEGSCCNNMGCHISPSDIKSITKEDIISLIDETNCISIDYYNGNPVTGECGDTKCFYLRIKNRDAKVIDAAFEGHCCTLLTSTGCPLSFEYRPKGARGLIPCHDKYSCKDTYSKQQCAAEWLSYNDIMQEVYNHYKQKGEVTINIMSFLEAVLGVM